jgi:hypothetical protein
MARRRFSLLTVALLLACVAADAPPPPAPFVYLSPSLSRLSAQQTDLILCAAEENKPQGRDLWFVAVTLNDGVYRCSAFAYYTPDEDSPRVRRGRCTDIRMGTQATVTPAGNVFGKEWGLSWNRKAEYVQVSPADKPFGETGAPLEAPAPAYVPFPKPIYPKEVLGDRKVEPISDAHLVGLVDFARGEFGLLGIDLKGERREEFKQQADAWHEPVCSVVIAGDDRYALAAGVSDWYGVYLHVKRGGDGRLAVTDSGIWSGADWVWWPEPKERDR